ncbi:hypothetical protein B0H11DRAFT_1913004 [Mycena galericulata]|nr:hypothetical protein B0H11DRAFT_1913004 [Mycena galericulata]
MHVKFGPFGKGAGTCQKQRRYARLHHGMRSQSATRMDNGARNILKAVEIYTRAMSEYFTSAGDPASTLAIRRPTERGLPHRRDENMPRVKRTRPGEGSTNLRRQPEHSAADGDSSTTDSLVGDWFPNSSGCGRSLETIEIPTRSSLTFCPHGDYDRDMMWSRELYIFLEPGKTMEWRNWSELSWMFMETRVENTIAIGLTASAATFGAEDWNEQKDLGRGKKRRRNAAPILQLQMSRKGWKAKGRHYTHISVTWQPNSVLVPHRDEACCIDMPNIAMDAKSSAA